MKWRDVMLVALMAALTFGGTFTCESRTRSHDRDGDSTRWRVSSS